MSDYIHLDSSYRDREDYPNPAEFVVGVQNMQTGWYREARRVRPTPSTQPRVLEAATSINIVDLMIPYTPELTSEPILYMDIHTINERDNPLLNTLNASVNDARFVLNFQYVQGRRETQVIAAISRNGANLVTVTTALPNNFVQNGTIIISGVTGATNFNGIFNINSVLSSTQFTYAQLDIADIGSGGTATSGSDTPIWIHYGTRMEQVTRFSRHQPIFFRIFDRTGTTISIIDNPVPQVPDPLKQVYVTLQITPYIRDGDYSNHLINVSSN